VTIAGPRVGGLERQWAKVDRERRIAVVRADPPP
jgi:hypothetical protein